MHNRHGAVAPRPLRNPIVREIAPAVGPALAYTCAILCGISLGWFGGGLIVTMVVRGAL